MMVAMSESGAPSWGASLWAALQEVDTVRADLNAISKFTSGAIGTTAYL